MHNVYKINNDQPGQQLLVDATPTHVERNTFPHAQVGGVSGYDTSCRLGWVRDFPTACVSEALVCR